MHPWPADHVERWPLDRLVPYARNARTHGPAQVDQIAASMREWGWTNPVLVDEAGTIIAGHGRIEAARKLGLSEAPVMVARPVDVAAIYFPPNWRYRAMPLLCGQRGARLMNRLCLSHLATAVIAAGVLEGSAFAGPLGASQAAAIPAPIAGLGLGALGLIGIGYGAIKRRIG